MTTQQDHFAALTELFTTPSSEIQFEPADKVVAAIHPRIECLIPGHLPVRATVWFLPCACMLNEDAGRGGLLRIEEDSTSLSSFTSAPGLEHDEWNTVSSALGDLTPHIPRWCIVPPVHSDPIFLDSIGFERITILSGTDQAAIVAAYQLCKAFASLPSPARSNLGICFVGSDADTAASTAERLAETAREQLGIDLQFRGSLHRIDDPTVRVQSSRLPHHEQGLPGLVSEIHRALASTEADRNPVPTSEVVPTPAAVIEPEPASVPPPPLVVEDASPGESNLDEAPGHLAQYVQQLQALPVNCPNCPEVDLAVDAQGRVHCLAQAEHLRQLHVASSWVLDHHHLLSLACPSTPLGTATEPACHLFTSHPPNLNDLQSTTLRLHLLTRVSIGEHSTWYACPLC